MSNELKDYDIMDIEAMDDERLEKLESGYRLNFYDWWGNRWLELAEKFKEAK